MGRTGDTISNMSAKAASGALIVEVRPSSIADEAGIRPGDRLIDMNGALVRDILDFRFFSADREVSLSIEKPDGEILVVDVTKDCDEPLGLDFGDVIFDGVRSCRNRCTFCFVDQLPRGVRRTLYVKDDDYRLSFLTGSYITLTNLTTADFDRITSMRLSPLYVSVHSTNPKTRGLLLGRKGPCDVMNALGTLVRSGITIHTQVVLCPGVNDGEELERTVFDLASLFPGVRSCAVVPVGLTRYRRGLAPVVPVSARDAAGVLFAVEKWQEEFMQKHSSRFVFAADELYLRAGKPIPPREAYEDFPQIENGVGMLRDYMDELAGVREKLPQDVKVPKRIVVITGEDAYPLIDETCKLLSCVKGLSCSALAVKNRFFGPRVSVAGLLTGQDIARSFLMIVGEGGCDAMVIPRVCLKADEPRFLDGMTVDDLAQLAGVPVDVAAPTPGSLAEHVLRRGGLSWEGR